ncbi:hypothetical protein D3C81_649810 [compost metagenome]
MVESSICMKMANDTSHNSGLWVLRAGRGLETELGIRVVALGQATIVRLRVCRRCVDQSPPLTS